MGDILVTGSAAPRSHLGSALSVVGDNLVGRSAPLLFDVASLGVSGTLLVAQKAS